jgi:hypothetical protein
MPLRRGARERVSAFIALLKRFAACLTPAQLEVLRANIIEETALRAITERK